MAAYNVLPWRVCEHRRRRTRFLVGMMVAVLLGVVGNSIPYHHLLGMLAQQQQANQQLQQQSRGSQQMLDALKKHQQQDQAVNTQITLVQVLKSRRAVDVALLTLLPQLVPEGLYLTHCERVGDQLHFVGKTQSNDQVSEMMHRITLLPMLQGPVLEQIDGNPNASQNNSFTLQATLTRFQESPHDAVV